MKLSHSKISLLVFLTFALVRFIFHFLTDSDHVQGYDYLRYDKFSNNILNGNFDLDSGPFIVAPLYPFFLAIVKLLFSSAWQTATIALQILVSAAAGLAFYNLGKLIFSCRRIALLATAIYCFFPFTLWFTNTISQESLFQSLLVITMYLFVKGLRSSNKFLIYSAFLFALTFLTKSHILLFAPILFFYILFSKYQNSNLKNALTFALICLIMTLPFGLFNLKKHDTYTFSSNGLAMFYYVSHNNFTYNFTLDPPELGSAEHKKYIDGLRRMIVMESFDDPEYYVANFVKLPVKERSRIYLETGTHWIKNNSDKFWRLKFHNLVQFLMPGFSKGHYSSNIWLISFLISLPIYIFFYVYLIRLIKGINKENWWILGLFLVMLLFVLAFYHQSRFRTVTLEPFYILFAAPAADALLKKLGVFKMLLRQ